MHTLNLGSQLPSVARWRVRHLSDVARGCKPVTGVGTRWNSALDMLRWVLEQQPVVYAALLSAEVSKTGDEVCALSDKDKTTTKGIANTMKSLKAAHLWSQQKRPTPFSVVAPLHAQLINDFINIMCIFFTFSFSIFRVLQCIVISIILYYMHLNILYHNTQQKELSLSLSPSHTF